MRLNVLSLFDGISCGRIALERAGIEVGQYFASEIDKYAIEISRKNYPDIIHIGDVKNVSYFDDCLAPIGHTVKIDLLIGGSPCQDLSRAKKNGKGLASNSQRYKAIGNGWTVDVIKHIFSFIPTK